MCAFQKLAFNEFGYVVRCIECGHYQVGFGTTMLPVSDDDYETLFNTVKKSLDNINADEQMKHDEIKSVVITTPLNGVCFIVTINELKHLYALLNNANNEIKALSLLQLFNN